MKTIQKITFVMTLTALALGVPGCATQNVNPPQARARTGYVDFYADPAGELNWDVSRFDDRRGSFSSVYSELEVPQAGILRLAFAPGRHRLRIAFLNRVIAKLSEVEVEVQDGKITPVRVTLTGAGVAQVRTKETNPGGSASGRYRGRTKIGSYETESYSLSAVAAPPVAYQLKERMPYAR